MNPSEQARFNDLRLRHLRGESLSQADAAELSAFTAILEAEEARMLQPARERLEAHIIATEQQIVEMQHLVARREALVAYLQQVHQHVAAEREAIDTAFHRLAGQGVSVMAGFK